MQPGAETWMVYGYGDEPTLLEFIAPEAGVYYITLATDAETGAAYSVLVEAGDVAEVLPLDEPAGAGLGGSRQAARAIWSTLRSRSSS